MTKFIYQS